MQNFEDANCRGWDGEPGPQGEWKLTKSEEGDFYYLTPAEWPDYYCYMQNTDDCNVRGWSGEPGPQGHWIITKIETE